MGTATDPMDPQNVPTSGIWTPRQQRPSAWRRWRGMLLPTTLVVAAVAALTWRLGVAGLIVAACVLVLAGCWRWWDGGNT